jgi:hypothetical protein
MELLLTALTLLATVYALLPRERRLDLRLKIRFLDWAAIVIGSLGIMYLEFYDFFLARDWVVHRPWAPGINAKNSAYLIFVVVSIFVWFRIFTSKLTRKNSRKFGELAEELLWSESYGELLALMHRHYKELFKIYKSDFAPSRWRNSLMRRGSFDSESLRQWLGSLDLPEPSDTTRSISKASEHPILQRAKSALLGCVSRFDNLLPDYEESKELAGDIIRQIVLSPRFVSALARTRPYFGLEILREAAKCREQFEFADDYLTELIGDPHSVLYAELSRNQNCSTYRYHLEPSNRLLNFFLADIKVAEHFHVYKAIGDFGVDYLRELGRNHASDPYNRAMDQSFENTEAWETPLFPIIRFFDIMVKEGLFQGIQWHMWLYYMPLLVEMMAKNYVVTADPLIDTDNEFPTRYSFLLYEAFSAMRYWAEAVIEVPPGQANVVLKSTRADHENGNIPKSAILALGECVRFVLESDGIAERQKGALVNMVFNLFFDFREAHGFADYAETLLDSLRYGGPHLSKLGDTYWQGLETAFDTEEHEFRVKRQEKDIDELEAMVRRGHVEKDHE